MEDVVGQRYSSVTTFMRMNSLTNSSQSTSFTSIFIFLNVKKHVTDSSKGSYKKDLLPSKIWGSLGHYFIWTRNNQAANHLWLVIFATFTSLCWVTPYQVRQREEKDTHMRMNNPQRQPFSDKGLTSSSSVTTSSRAFFFREENFSRAWQPTREWN